MIKLRHQEPSLGHSGLAKAIEDLWEPWMREVDQLLEDATLVEGWKRYARHKESLIGKA